MQEMIPLKGAAVSAKLKQEVQDGLTRLHGGYIPKLAIVRVGEKPDDMAYERSAIKKIQNFGLEAVTYSFPETISDEDFKQDFRRINENPEITGILLLLPLPGQICQKEIEKMIDPAKDMDGISPMNQAKVFAGDPSGYAPCTAEAVIEVLKGYEIPIEGKRVTIVGRSMVVGKPLSMLLLKENATVTICHTRTRDLPSECRHAEILVAAAGRAKMLGAEAVGEGAVVIDVGINVDADGKLCGDVDYEAIKDAAAMATPVPGGVGAVTTAVLAKHLMRAALEKESSERG